MSLTKSNSFIDFNIQKEDFKRFEVFAECLSFLCTGPVKITKDFKRDF